MVLAAGFFGTVYLGRVFLTHQWMNGEKRELFLLMVHILIVGNRCRKCFMQKGMERVYSGRSYVRPEPVWANWVKPPAEGAKAEQAFATQMHEKHNKHEDVFHIQADETAETFCLPNPAAASCISPEKTTLAEKAERQAAENQHQPRQRLGGLTFTYVLPVVLLVVVLLVLGLF